MKDTDKSKVGALFVWGAAAALCVIAAIYYWVAKPTQEEQPTETEVTTETATEAATVTVEAEPSSETEEVTTEEATTEETTTEAEKDMPSGVIGE